MDEMMEKMVYPCKAATDEELLQAVAYMVVGHIHNWKDLPRLISEITEEDISAHKFRNMLVLDNAHDSCNSALGKASLNPGTYTNHSGDWLILIHPKKSEIQAHLTLCSKQLKCLWIYNTSYTSLDFPSLIALEKLSIISSYELSIINGLEHMNSLRELELLHCKRLMMLPGLSSLTQLVSLTINGCEKLRELPGLKKLTELTSLKLDNCYNLAKLSGLGNLTRLATLELSCCWELTKLPGLGNLTQLSSLSLSGCHGLTELPGLKKLSQLKSLETNGCAGFTRLPELKNLTQLTSLNMVGCENLVELQELENLTQLTTLDISGCTRLRELPGLGNLTRLTSLGLRGCESLSALTGLEKLIHLTSLSLGKIVSLTELHGLENLTELKSLLIYQCNNLRALPGMCNLTKLTDLNIWQCSSLHNLPELENLTQLTYLALQENDSLLQLPSFKKMAKLVELHLANCKNLRKLPDFGTHPQLSKLILLGCTSIETLPDSIRTLSALKSLNLSYLHLKVLPDWLPEITEHFSTDEDSWRDGIERAVVSLCGTTVEDIPDMSIFEQPYEVVAEWFRNRSLGRMRSLNEIKVVFLGDGEAGKSHTIARLMNDGGEPVGYVDSSTPGIVIKNKDYTVEGRRFQVHYWDFGGQEIMHSMHRIFLTGRTMYVVLLNARDDTQSDRAKYWLHNIKSFAPDAPVLLVLNKIDQNGNASVDEPDLRSRYGKLTQVVRLSARDFSREQFNNCFTKVLLEEILNTGFLDAEWPDSWTRVKERLEHMESHYIKGSDYQGICAECQVDENRKNLLHWFNDLGVSFCCDGEDDYTLEDYVILRPDWITNALYIILFNRLEGARNGLIPHRAIYDILKSAHRNPDIRCTLPEAKYNSSEIGYVLGVMRKFSLSFPEGKRHEFIPMLCQQNSTVNVQTYRENSDVLEFNMEFDYLPNNLLHRLMVERHSELDMDNVWRTGARFVLPEPGYSAVVVIDGNTLRFFIRHSDPMHRPNTYLTMLKANVERIVREMGLKEPVCQLVYKLDGRQDEFEYEMLKGMRSIGQTQAYSRQWCRMISIEDILNQSAPDGLEDERKLLEAIRKACLQMMAEPDYHLTPGETGWGMEDKRNRRVRDTLEMRGYDVHDQTQRGLSGTRRGIGELDLLLMNDRKEPWTIIEALRVSGVRMPEWKSHLDKLVENYNYFGAPCLYLLTYVDTDETRFKDIWESYLGHISGYGPGKFTFVDGSLAVLDHGDSPRNVKTAACQYTCGGQRTTAYHIFAQIPMRRE